MGGATTLPPNPLRETLRVSVDVHHHTDLRAGGVAISAWLAAGLGLFFYIARYHEFWRDEVQPALVARAVPLAELVPAMRREAVPPVIYLVNKAAAWLPPPYSLSAVGAIGFLSLLFGTYALLYSLSGRHVASTLITGALALTDTYCYELGVVVRQYGLGLGFALVSVAYLARALRAESRRYAWLGSAFGALAVATSAHPGCLAGGALLSYSALKLAENRTLASIAEPLCALPAFLFTFFLLAPYDRAPELLVVYHRTFSEDAALLAWALLDGSVCLGWWSPPSAEGLRFLVACLTAAALLGIAVARVRGGGRPSRLALFYAGSLGVNALTLAYIFAVRNPGKHRHHLFLCVPVLVVALGVLLRRGDASATTRPPAWVMATLLLPWFAFQYATAVADLLGDVRDSFSGTKAAAAALPPGARTVEVGEDWVACGILYWRQDVTMRAQSSQGRPFRYLYQDWHWHDRVPLMPLLEEECRHAPAIYIVQSVEELQPELACAQFLLRPSSLEHSERFTLLRMECSCFALVAHDGLPTTRPGVP
jgi:hypothetical protein